MDLLEELDALPIGVFSDDMRRCLQQRACGLDHQNGVDIPIGTLDRQRAHIFTDREKELQSDHSPLHDGKRDLLVLADDGLCLIHEGFSKQSAVPINEFLIGYNRTGDNLPTGNDQSHRISDGYLCISWSVWPMGHSQAMRVHSSTRLKGEGTDGGCSSRC